MKSQIDAMTVFSSKGDRVAQEDHVIANEDRGIFVVADGFGGPIPGFEAAKAACEGIQDFLAKEAGDVDATLPFELRRYLSLSGNILFNSIVHANRKLIESNDKKSVHQKGGASIIAGYLDGNRVSVASVGSCQSWLIRNSQRVALSLPQTLARQVDPFDSFERPSQNVPLMAMGVHDDLEPDMGEYEIHRGDWLVMNSDGVSSPLLDEIALIQDPEAEAAESIRGVKKHLGEQEFGDNSSLLLVIF